MAQSAAVIFVVTVGLCMYGFQKGDFILKSAAVATEKDILNDFLELVTNFADSSTSGQYIRKPSQHTQKYTD
jgi:hypothetical protein